MTSMFAPFTTPLRTLLFAAGGAGLAWVWYDVSEWFAAFIALLVWLLVLVSQGVADSMVATQPLAALQLFELRILGIAAVSAALAASVIIVTVELAAPDTAGAATKELIAAVTAAVTAFMTGISVSAEDADGSIGDFVKAKFQDRFVAASTTEKRSDQVALPDGSRALKAIYTTYEYGWNDWSKATRKARITALAEGLVG